MKNKIYIIHENDEWILPLRKELQEIKKVKQKVTTERSITR